ncbi:hypothetical protein [Halorubellus litoreus]|uniref:Halobacterial output domain-containing protein n=1 Tax=Halorubellus litoreus TaxID=755308 RepID=A0ABD5VNG2_9EURY
MGAYESNVFEGLRDRWAAWRGDGEPAHSRPLGVVQKRGREVFGVKLGDAKGWQPDWRDVEDLHEEAMERYEIRPTPVGHEVATVHFDADGNVVDVEWFDEPRAPDAA